MNTVLDSAHLTAARAVFALEALITAVGALTNPLLFLATTRSSTLKTKCNFLIGACALFDSIHLIGNFVGLTIMVGDGQMDAFTCSALLFIPEIFLYAGCFCVLSIGIDRLISVTSAVFYRNVNRTTYLAAHMVAIFTFSSYAPFLMINYYRSQRLICSMPEPYHGYGKLLWIQAMIIINVIALVLYALTWRSLRSRDCSSYSKRVFRAIALVMIFDVGGWLVAVALTKLIHTVDISDAKRIVIQYFCGCIVHFGIAIKPIIYYSTSSDYRTVFRQFLGLESSPASKSQFSSQAVNIEQQLPLKN